jgi:ribose transport system permease protein
MQVAGVWSREKISPERLGRLLAGRPGSVRRPALFVLVAGIVASFASSSFLTVANVKALLTSSSFLIVTAVGEAFVILMGMIDLGVESMLSAAGMFCAWMYVFQKVAAPLAMLMALGFGLLGGIAVGLLVTRARIPSFIVTLGTYWGLEGVALLFNQGNYISPNAVSPPRPFTFGGIAGNSFGISNLVFLSIGVVILGQIVVSYTPLGSWTKSVGSSEEAARSVGLDTRRLKVFAFAVSGVLAALAGVMITAWQASIYPLSGQGYSLQAIAAVILGGIPFSGGRGSLVGAALGALIIGIINDIIVLVGLPSLYEYIFVASILVIAGLQARGGEFVK